MSLISLIEKYSGIDYRSKKALKSLFISQANPASKNDLMNNVVKIKFSSCFKEGNGVATLLTSAGHILAAYHVIERIYAVNATAKIITYDNKKYSLPTDNLWFDHKHDLCILKARTYDLFPKPNPIKVNHQYNYALGDEIQVYSYSQNTPQINKGTITIPSKEGIMKDGHYYLDFFQTNAIGKKGMSGSPITNKEGEIIGVAIAKLSEDGKDEGYICGAKLSPVMNYIERI